MAFAMNEDFSHVLSKQMDHWSDPRNDKINQMKKDIDDTKNIMVQNIEKVLERGERIDLLVTRTEEMQEQSYKFKSGATDLKKKLWWKNMKLWIVIAVLVVVRTLVSRKCPAYLFSITVLMETPPYRFWFGSSHPPYAASRSPSAGKCKVIDA